MLQLFACAVAVCALVCYALKEDPQPILGVYQQRGKWYWLKYFSFLGLYHYRKMSHKNARAEGSQRAGQGVKAILEEAEMEKAQLLSDDSKAFDAVFFIAAKSSESPERGFYMQAGCERRQMGICNGLFYLGVPGIGLLCSKKLPDTMLFGSEPRQFGAEGLLITPVEPMKKWKVTYKGKMWLEGSPDKWYEVEFVGDWTARWRPFDYDIEIHPPAVARSIAIQPWSRDYFQMLKTAHQSHYEQFGSLVAEFHVDGKEYHMQNVPAFRDHSFGNKRDWSLMHRYVFHHIFLEDDTRISVGVICQPSTSSNFEAGCVCVADGCVHAVEWCDLVLYQHGEDGCPPQQYAFRLAAGGRVYTVKVYVEYQSEHFKGWEWESRLVERFCRYDVDGVAGRGTCEFQYAYKAGRPARIAAEDPEWYRKHCHEL